jgi:hypothetical protein
MHILRSMSKDHRIRTPSQGEFLVAKTQAWKAWAMVSNRFAVGPLRFPFPGGVQATPLQHVNRLKWDQATGPKDCRWAEQLAFPILDPLFAKLGCWPAWSEL